MADYAAKRVTQTRYRSADDIHRVILIYDGTNVSSYNRVNNIIRSFKNEGKDVTCLVYFNKKELDDICLTQNQMQFISKSEFDWLGLPVKSFIDEFLNYQYDLCINLNLFYSENVEMLCRLCDAELKAGKDFGSRTVADLMIKMNDDKDETFLVEQIKYYLRNVKSNER